MICTFPVCVNVIPIWSYTWLMYCRSCPMFGSGGGSAPPPGEGATVIVLIEPEPLIGIPTAAPAHARTMGTPMRQKRDETIVMSPPMVRGETPHDHESTGASARLVFRGQATSNPWRCQKRFPSPEHRNRSVLTPRAL